MIVTKRFHRLRKMIRPLLRDLYKLFLFFPSCGKWISHSTVKMRCQRKRLVVLRPDGIGDYVLFSRDFHRLRYLYPSPEWQIILVGNKVWKSLADELNLSAPIKYYDRFVGVDRSIIRSDAAYRKELARALSSLCCDELIYPVHSRDVWGCLMAAWINAPIKTAPAGDTDNLNRMFKWVFDRIFDRLLDEPRGLKLEVSRTDHFLKKLGDSTPIEETFLPLQLSTEMVSDFLKLFSKLGFEPTMAYAVICPGAAWEKKRWPKENFVAWGRYQAEINGYGILVCGGPNESELGEWIAENIGPKAINLAGRTSLIELTGILAHAKICIANDTAAVHISAAFDRHTICIIGGGHWGRFWPYANKEKNIAYHTFMPCFGCGWECKYVGEPVPCIESVKWYPASI